MIKFFNKILKIRKFSWKKDYSKGVRCILLKFRK